MELIDIIKSTISIFSAIVFGSIAISYAIYKIKNHSSPKPRARLNPDNSFYGTILNSKDIEFNREKLNGREIKSSAINQSMQHKFNLINANNRLSKTDDSGSITLNPMNKTSFKNKGYL